MRTHDALLEQNLYTVTIENVTVGLLLDYPDKSEPLKNDLPYFTRHQHAYTELFVCLSGQITINTENGDYTLSSGDAAFIPANYMHIKLFDDNNADYRTIGMTFTRRYPKNSFNLYRVMMKFCGEGSILLLRGRLDFCEGVATLFDAVGGDPYLPALRLAMLLVEEARELQSPIPAELHGGLFHAKELDRISLLDYLVDSCFMHPLTVSYAADQLCMSERQFSRLVKKRFGSSFHDVIKVKRLTVAAKMLIESDRPVSKIAPAVGYPSVSCFHRAFAAYWNMTPARYREAGKNGTS